jgi:transcriptional regulator with XRE-family HTH domain
MLDRQSIAQPDPEYQVPAVVKEPTRDADLIVIGRALRALRDHAGVTQEQLAARLHIDATYVSRIERGRRGVQWLTIQRFLRALRADLHQLADAVAEAEKQQRAGKR